MKDPEREWADRLTPWGPQGLYRGSLLDRPHTPPDPFYSLCPCYTSSPPLQWKWQAGLDQSQVSLQTKVLFHGIYLLFTSSSHYRHGNREAAGVTKGKGSRKAQKIGHMKYCGRIYEGGSMGGKSNVIAPPVDSRGNGTATRSLTKLIIINQAQPLTYASLLQSLCPLLSSPFSILSFSPFLGFTCYHLALCLLLIHCLCLGQQEEQDEVINYTHNSSLVTTHSHIHTQTHSPTSPPGLLHDQSCLWESCDDGWEELWSCPIKLCVYWGQMASTHTTQQRSRPLVIKAEGLRLLAPYIRQDKVRRRALASDSRES